MAENTEYTKIKESTISSFFTKLKAFFWPKSDVTNVTLADVALTGDYDDLINKLVVDATPTQDSTNPVSSGGVKTALDSCAKKNQIVAEFDLSSAEPTIGTITSGSYSSVIQGMENGNVPTLHIIIKNNGVVVTSTTTNLITNDYTYSFDNNNYTSLLFGVSYYSDGSIKSEGCVVFHDNTNDVDCVHMLPVSQINPASTSDLSNVVHKTSDETIGGTKTFNGDIHINTNNEIRFQDQTEGNDDNNLQIQYDNGDLHLYAFYGDSKPKIIGVGNPVNNYDVANKVYVDTATLATRYEPTQATPYLAIRLGTTDQQSIFITAGADGVSSSFYVIPGDNDCVIIGDFDETDLVFSYADGVSDFGYNTALLISSNYGSAFNVFNLGSLKMDVELVSSSGLEIGEFNGQILRWQNKLTFDSIPTANSTNPITSGGVASALSEKETASNKVTAISSSSTDTQYPSAKCVYDKLIEKADVITVGSSMPSGGFLPNVYYSLGTVSDSVTWTLAASSSVVDEYMIQFSTGSTAPTITWPSGITWFGGSAPTINENKTYQISIQNNLAVCGEF